MSTVADRSFNDSFLEKAGSAEGRTKIMASTGTYLRDRLREVSFARKIVPPTPVVRSDLQASVNHDTLVYLDTIEPQSKAMAITFRGTPRGRQIRAARYEIPFWTISSEIFEKTEQELMVYTMPLTKVIEENSGKDLQYIEDRQYLIFVESAIQSVMTEFLGAAFTAATPFNENFSVVKGEGAIAAGGTSFTSYPVQKTDFIKLKQMLHRRSLKAEQLLITESDFDNLSAFTISDVGMTIAGETSTEGWKSSTVTGLKIIRTIKNDILREGNVYCFTSPEFHGRFLILNTTKFYIDKVRNVISWSCWEDIGMAIGNTASIVKLELYPGSVTPGFASAGSEVKLPKAEDDIFRVNNRVDDGKTYPDVSQF